jgi:hypothetical protein
MFRVSSTAAALLSAVLALVSIDDAYSCASHHEVKEHQLDDSTNAGTNLRSLIANNAGVSGTQFLCGTPDRTKNEVRAFANMVDQFYQGSQGGNRRLQQQYIVIRVNFVAVQHTDGRGATQEQVDNQIFHLNAAYQPDFIFVVDKLQIVTDDNYFSNVDSDDPDRTVEKQMKTQYKLGGRETLSVYAVDPRSKSGSIGGWAFFPSDDVGVMDGVVMRYSGITGGGDWYFSEGDVSIRSERS